MTAEPGIALPRPANDAPAPNRERALFGQPAGYLLTLADLMALLLTFFVMLYAMSSPMPPAFRAIVDSFGARLNPDGHPFPGSATAVIDAPRIAVSPGEDLGYLRAVLEDQIRRLGSFADARFDLRDGRLTVRVPSRMLLADGTALLTPQAARDMSRLGELLSGIANRIEVHGPGASVNGGAGQIGWNMSYRTAEAIATAMTRGGVAMLPAAFGRIASGDTAVEIVLRLNREAR